MQEKNGEKKRAKTDTKKSFVNTSKARYVYFVPAEYRRMTQSRGVDTVEGSSFTGPVPSDSDNAH